MISALQTILLITLIALVLYYIYGIITNKLKKSIFKLINTK